MLIAKFNDKSKYKNDILNTPDTFVSAVTSSDRLVNHISYQSGVYSGDDQEIIRSKCEKLLEVGFSSTFISCGFSGTAENE